MAQQKLFGPASPYWGPSLRDPTAEHGDSWYDAVRKCSSNFDELYSKAPFSAQRLLAGAQRPLGDISVVMASPPTITDPVSDGANSTVQTGQSTSAGMFSSADTARVTIFGGPMVSTRIATVTRQAGARLQGHGACIAFYTDADTVDFAIRCNGNKWIAYVTTPDGVRARIATNDRTQAFSNLNYYNLAFGSTAGGGRLVEVYLSNVGNYGGINVPTGYSIWPADLAYQPRIAGIGDSYFEGSMNDGNLNLKLALMDWFAGTFGVNNPLVNGVGSTGVIANAGASNFNTFQQRLDAGDLDESRVGAFDLVFAPGSINDDTLINNGVAIPAGNATVQAAYQTYIQTLMTAQPRAIIVGAPQEFRPAAAADASRVAAYKAGFQAAAGGLARMIWLDGTLFESAPDTGVIGADNTHPDGVFGARHIGERLARKTLNYIRNSSLIA